MSYLLPTLVTKTEVDDAIKSTEDVVLVLRFGRDDDPVCLQLDNIVRFYLLLHVMCFRGSTFTFTYQRNSFTFSSTLNTTTTILNLEYT